MKYRTPLESRKQLETQQATVADNYKDTVLYIQGKHRNISSILQDSSLDSRIVHGRRTCNQTKRQKGRRTSQPLRESALRPLNGRLTNTPTRRGGTEPVYPTRTRTISVDVGRTALWCLLLLTNRGPAAYAVGAWGVLLIELEEATNA